MSVAYVTESWTEAERAALAPFFTDLEGPVFALRNLPEVVKAALFARYSRSPRSLRRLFLDEFVREPDLGIAAIGERVAGDGGRVDLARATALYEKIFSDYGDDSVAQLGGVHLACEQASNLLTKVLERGRLAAYLEQSTRYIRFDRPLGGRYRYLVPPEVSGSSMEGEYRAVLDGLFATYTDLQAPLTAHLERTAPPAGDLDVSAFAAAVRARVCDDLRGLLPAATLSNLGIFASAQAYEALVLRMRAHPLAEVRDYGERILVELRALVPAFVRRIDVPERGGRWVAYLEDRAARTAAAAASLDAAPRAAEAVELVEWDPDGEVKVVAAALYPYTDLPDRQLLELARAMPEAERAAVLAAAAGARGNRRHKPGRAFERVAYRFDILADYGIFRDLQRHRLLTIEWQRLSPGHGWVVPDAVAAAGLAGRYRDAVERAAALSAALRAAHGADVAQYAVPLACRVRFSLQMNAREAFHLLELRTAPGGHPSYRRVCQQMHRLIRDRAGHRALAAAMCFVDHDEHELGRLESERRAAARARGVASDEPGPMAP